MKSLHGFLTSQSHLLWQSDKLGRSEGCCEHNISRFQKVFWQGSPWHHFCWVDRFRPEALLGGIPEVPPLISVPAKYLGMGQMWPLGRSWGPLPYTMVPAWIPQWQLFLKKNMCNGNNFIFTILVWSSFLLYIRNRTKYLQCLLIAMDNREQGSCCNLYAYFSKLCFGYVAKEQSVLFWHPFFDEAEPQI